MTKLFAFASVTIMQVLCSRWNVNPIPSKPYHGTALRVKVLYYCYTSLVCNKQIYFIYVIGTMLLQFDKVIAADTAVLRCLFG
jgi:hypothetical protein